MSDFGQRFREAHDYSVKEGFVTGFPNFHEANYGPGLVRGTIFLRVGFATFQDVPASVLGNPPEDDVGARFRATYDYATKNGFVGGFPNFNRADYGHGLVYGTAFLGSQAAEFRDVSAADLGNPPDGDLESRFRAVYDYAVRNGFAAGFPNFNRADYGHGLVYGTTLIYPAAAEKRDVLDGVLDTTPYHCAMVIIQSISGGEALGYKQTNPSRQAAEEDANKAASQISASGITVLRIQVSPGKC